MTLSDCAAGLVCVLAATGAVLCALYVENWWRWRK